jgi:hypothetical protein
VLHRVHRDASPLAVLRRVHRDASPLAVLRRVHRRASPQAVLHRVRVVAVGLRDLGRVRSAPRTAVGLRVRRRDWVPTTAKLTVPTTQAPVIIFFRFIAQLLL